MSETRSLNPAQERALDLMSYLAVNLVDHPDEVSVSRTEKQGREVYQVRVHPDDLGKIIGKGGQTARAIRTLLTAVSSRTDQRLGLEIVD